MMAHPQVSGGDEGLALAAFYLGIRVGKPRFPWHAQHSDLKVSSAKCVIVMVFGLGDFTSLGGDAV